MATATATKTAKKVDYFKGVTCIEELKKLYHELVKVHHPDIGGDIEVMKAINAQFDVLHPKLKNIHKTREGKTWEAKGDKCDTQRAAEYREIIMRLFPVILKLKGVTIEIVGCWIWLTGETKQYAEILKKCNFFFSGQKKAWYFNGSSVKVHRVSHYKTYEEVRSHWSHVKVDGDDQQAIKG